MSQYCLSIVLYHQCILNVFSHAVYQCIVYHSIVCPCSVSVYCIINSISSTLYCLSMQLNTRRPNIHFDMPPQDRLEEILAEGIALGVFEDVSIYTVEAQVRKRINHLRDDAETLRLALEAQHHP